MVKKKREEYIAFEWRQALGALSEEKWWKWIEGRGIESSKLRLFLVRKLSFNVLLNFLFFAPF